MPAQNLQGYLASSKRIILSRGDSCSSLAVVRCLAIKAGATCPPPIGSEKNGSCCQEVTCAQAWLSEGASRRKRERRRVLRSTQRTRQEVTCAQPLWSAGGSDVVPSSNRLGEKRISLKRSDLCWSLEVGRQERRRVLLKRTQSKTGHFVEK